MRLMVGTAWFRAFCMSGGLPDELAADTSSLVAIK